MSVAKRASRSTRQATGKAVSKALADRGGSAFRITTEQRKAIVRDANTKTSQTSGRKNGKT